MPLQTPSSPHVHQPTSVTAIMLRVVYALIPGIITYIYFFGWAIVVNLTLAALVALLCEALMLTIRRRPVIPFLMDGSALVTALLLALAIPTLAPWWLTTVGVAFAIIIAKQLYGGLGYNPFNPAMVGYAILMISFPREMTAWLPPEQLATESFNLIESASIIFTGLTTSGIAFDAVSSATPLDILKTGVNLAKPISDVVAANPIFNAFAGVGWMWVNIAFLVGGVWLIHRRIISWHIPAGLLVTLAAVATLFYLINSEQYANPLFHLLSGATMLGAFFIATDPVTASTTPLGKLIYGAGVGLLIYIIRKWGGFPDAIAFAVLIMNMLVPTIDHYTQPRIYGRRRSG